MKLSDVEVGGPLVVLMKGQAGTGKSIAAASFPEPLLLFDIDGRVKSLANHYRSRSREIEVEQFGRGDWVRLAASLERIQQSPKKYNTYVFDSLTNYADRVIQHCLGDRGNGKKIGGIDVSGWDEFNAEDAMLTKLIDVALWLGQYANVVVTGHIIASKETKDPDGRTVITRSLTTAGNKIAAKIPTRFNEVWHFAKENSIDVSAAPKHMVYFTKAGIDDAKTALPLPESMNFTGKDLFPMMRDHLNKKGLDLFPKVTS